MSYLELKKLRDEIGQIYEISSIMHWDSSVIMPRKSASARGRSLELLADLAHNKTTSSEFKTNLELSLREQRKLSVWDKKNLDLINKEYLLATCLPTDLVRDISSATSECEMEWRKARNENNFDTVRPNLEKVFALTLEKSKRFGEVLEKTPYDSLLDQYDSGQNQASIDLLFNLVESEIPKLLTNAQASQKKKPAFALKFPKEAQERILRNFLPKLQFDFEAGRLDESTHPFCGGIPEDIRITTRYYQHDFSASFLGVVHEAGHALYERNLPKEFSRQPVGSACSFSIHESQSLFVEKQICKSRPFLEFFHTTYFSKEFDLKNQYSLDDLYNYINYVTPSFIRVDADEVTYPLHILVRYKIEKALFSSEIKIKDISAYFDELYEKYLGIRPKTHSEGCLQDIHWYMGGFGYFPSYTLGAMTAAQLMSTVKATLPDTKSNLRNANFSNIFKWLNENIHKHGSLHSSQDLLKLATGEGLNPKYFLDYLKEKYT